MSDIAGARRKEYRVGYIIKPGDPWSYFGKPSDLDDDWMPALGQYLDPEKYPELFEKVGYKHGRRGDLFRLPDKSQEVVTAVGGENFFASHPTYQDGYKDAAAGAYPIIKVK